MFKKQYTFSLLKREQTIASSLEKSAVFFGMRDETRNRAWEAVAETLDALIPLLSNGQYYIAHNIVVTKGRKELFRGELAVALRDDLVSFLGSSIDQGDIRPFLISPVFSGSPDYVIDVSEDGAFFFYRAREAVSQESIR